MAPLLFRDTTLGGDYGLHQWLVWHQEQAIRAGGFPSYFSHFDPVGFFSPSGIFWGGTLYGAVGYLAVPLGATRAFVLAYVLLAWGALLGCWMLSRTLGLGGWRAHVPGIAMVTAAWYLGEGFGRAGFGSFAALSSMPLFLAGAVGVARRESIRTADAVALVVGTVLAFGAHNLSMLWGTVFLVLGAFSLLVFVRRVRLPPFRRLLSIAVLAGVGVGINAWFLVPNLVYSSRTRISNVAAMDSVADASFARPEVVFHPLRVMPEEQYDFWRWQADIHGYPFERPISQYTQFPILAFGWAAVVVAATRRQREAQMLRRLFLAATAVVCCFLALVLKPSLFEVLPTVFQKTQFAFRMHSYALFGFVFAMGVAAAALLHLRPRPRRIATGALAAIGMFSVAITLWQGGTATSLIGGLGYDVPRSEILAMPHAAPFWYPYNDFWDQSAPIVEGAAATISLGPYEAIDNGRLRTTVTLPVVDVADLRLGTGSYLVRVSGLRVLGRTRDGLVAVEGARPGEPTERDIVVERARTWPLTVGPAITLLSLMGLGALIVTRAARFAWRRRDGITDVPLKDHYAQRRPA